MTHKLLLLATTLLMSGPKTKYLILVGDITCKNCVVQLHNHLNSRSSTVTIGIRDKQNFILNQTAISYFKKELPKATFFIIENQSLFPSSIKKYPYVLKINRGDTLFIPYDSLFIGEYLNLNSLL